MGPNPKLQAMIKLRVPPYQEASGQGLMR
ncbi:hypothetical protein HaLaN_24914 [Haematococcus lacustris]|uniref:Uncharacterized protein n=1 Tax=Haematococcus lacustris TaxID=44745 RepID=A0A6A0A1Z4_HAELA|nr:hypothetical protein HaLaN_24914 [Haematococcus lacustris]